MHMYVYGQVARWLGGWVAGLLAGQAAGWPSGQVVGLVDDCPHFVASEFIRIMTFALVLLASTRMTPFYSDGKLTRTRALKP